MKIDKKSFLKILKNNKKTLLISITSIFAGLTGSYIIKSRNFLENVNNEESINNNISGINDEALIHLNKIEYIETERIENLALYARFKNALTLIRFSNLTKNQHDRDRVVHELVKLNNLNDGLIQIIAQTIRDDHDLILNLASNPKIDNRILPNCPPSVEQDLKKYKRTAKLITPTLAEDDDFNFIFDFYMNKIGNLKFDKSSITASNIKFYVKKFFSALNSLLLHDYKLKKHNTILNDLIFLHDTDLDLDRVTSDEDDVEKEKANMTKHEFLSRLEFIILQILDNYAKFSQKEFIKFGGLDILLILYEKHKTNMEFLIPIFDILSIMSLNHENKALFINSGWIKRIHELCVKLNTELNTVNLMTNLFLNNLSIENYYKSLEQSLILKLIVYKIMFNLKSFNKVVFSNMIYPLYPLKSELNRLDMETSTNSLQVAMNPDEPVDENDSEDAIDVVFIHGLLGSVFKTWRQDDHHLKQLYELIDKLKLQSASIYELDTKMNELRDKLKSIYDNSTMILPNILSYINYTYCWPKDWLSTDFNGKVNIYGVNYSSILSYWGGDDKTKDNSTIKMRSNELANQLNLANIGKKPIIWVCHSMGGLILKQMLLNLSNSPEGSSIIENTKGIVFYSTPHLGSALAKRAMHLSLALWPSKEIDELALNNKYLIKLNQEFVSFLSKKNWKIVSFCENLSTNVGYNLKVKLVDENSAKLPGNLSEFIILERDHLYVCKPESKESVIYKSVSNLINDVYNDYSKERQQARKKQAGGKNYYKKFKYVNYFFKEFLF